MRPRKPGTEACDLASSSLWKQCEIRKGPRIEKKISLPQNPEETSSGPQMGIMTPVLPFLMEPEIYVLGPQNQLLG